MTHSIEQFHRQLDLDVGFVDAIRSSACQGYEAVRYKDIPEDAYALIGLLGCDVGPGRLLMERVLEDEPAGDSNAAVCWTGRVDESVVQSLFWSVSDTHRCCSSI